MTTYFDTAHEDIAKALNPRTEVSAEHPTPQRPDHEVAAAFDDIEGRVTFDCTVCAMWQGFPEDLRERVHRTILAHGVGSLPVNAPGKEIDTIEEHRNHIDRLIFDLHTIWHDLLLRRLDSFSDDPRLPLRILYARGEGERECMVEAAAPPAPGENEPRCPATFNEVQCTEPKGHEGMHHVPTLGETS
jgi:hypothetical protein